MTLTKGPDHTCTSRRCRDSSLPNSQPHCYSAGRGLLLCAPPSVPGPHDKARFPGAGVAEVDDVFHPSLLWRVGYTNPRVQRHLCRIGGSELRGNHRHVLPLIRRLMSDMKNEGSTIYVAQEWPAPARQAASINTDLSFLENQSCPRAGTCPPGHTQVPQQSTW